MYLEPGTHKIDGATIIVDNDTTEISSIKLSSNKLYWVGTNNDFGKLRYQYYKLRGWIMNDIYFAKPANKTIEWLRCLVSKKHAETTWLRIDAEKQERVLRRFEAAVTALFVAVIFIAGICYGQVRYAQHLKANGITLERNQ